MRQPARKLIKMTGKIIGKLVRKPVKLLTRVRL